MLKTLNPLGIASLVKLGINVLIALIFIIIAQKFLYFAIVNILLIKNTVIYFLSSSYLIGPITVQAVTFFFSTFVLFTIFRVFRNLF